MSLLTIDKMILGENSLWDIVCPSVTDVFWLQYIFQNNVHETYKRIKYIFEVLWVLSQMQAFMGIS